MAGRPTFDPRKRGAKCDECPLARQKPVKPHLNKATIALVSKGPGAVEEEEGKFFVGPTGRKIKEGCEAFDIPIPSIHWNNALLCRPPGRLTNAEVKQAAACCKPRLLYDLKRSGAKWILAADKLAAQVVAGKHRQDAWAGPPLDTPDLPGCKTIITIQPAAALHKPALWPVFWIHLNRIWDFATSKLKPWKWPQIKVLTGKTPKNEPKVFELLQRMRGAKVLGVDVETLGTDPTTAPLTACGISTTNYGVSFTPEAATPRIWKLYKELCENDTPKALHNGSYDLLSLRANDIELGGYDYDTLLMHSVVAPDLPHNLGFAAQLEFHMPRWKTEFRVTGDAKGSEAYATRDKVALCVYNAKDCLMTAKLVRPLMRSLKDVHRGHELYDDLLRLQKIATGMQERGLHVNKAAVEKHVKRYKRRRREALRQMRKTARAVRYKKWKTFNPRSPAQLKDLMFNHLKVVPRKFSPLTGEPSLDDSQIQRLIAHPSRRVSIVARALHRYRRADKLLSYVDRLNGTIHATARVAGTRTGRWSYSPNMQNWPAEIRDVIQARPGHVLIEADKAQLELRIMAVLAREPNLLDAFKRGEDVHKRNQIALLGEQSLKGSKLALKKRRTLIKVFVYAVNYQASARTVWQNMVVDFPGLRLGDIEQMQERWNFKRPRIQQYARHERAKVMRLQKKTNTGGYLEIPISGQRYYFYGEVPAITKIANIRVQGMGAAMLNDEVRRLDVKLPSTIRPVLQIHDAVLVECPKRSARKAVRLLRKEMQKPVSVSFDDGTTEQHVFPIDIKIGTDWLNMRELGSSEEP